MEQTPCRRARRRDRPRTSGNAKRRRGLRLVTQGVDLLTPITGMLDPATRVLLEPVLATGSALCLHVVRGSAFTAEFELREGQ